MVREHSSARDETKVRHQEIPFRSPLGLTLVALGLGLGVEILFDGHPLGISFPIWAFLCVAALIGLSILEGIRPSRLELALGIPLLFFAVMAALRLEPLTVFLDVVVTLALFAVWVRTFRAGQLLEFGWIDFGLSLIWVPLEAWINPWPVAGAAWGQVVGERKARSRLLAVLRGLLLAIPILVVFIALLSSADLVFADVVENTLSWLDLERLARWFRGALIVIVSAAFFLGALISALRDTGERRLIGLERPLVSPFLGFIEAMVVLVAVDLLFAGFVGIQFAYLFGGETNITVTGYTYAEYARRGFVELVAVAFLSLGLILALGSWARREGQSRARWFNGLCAALVGLVGVILVSALRRLLLYENAYGFTRLRTYTHVAIFWMGSLFVVFLGLLVFNQLRRFAPASAIAVLGFVATLNLLNVDAFIVRQNANRLYETGDIDVQYLGSLTDDAVPGLIRLIQTAPEDVRLELLPQLACRYAELVERSMQLSWPSYHGSRATAMLRLADIEKELAPYTVEPYKRGWIVTGPRIEVICAQPWD